MERFFASGAAVDAVLAVLAIEFVVLTALARERAATALTLVFALGPGACILLALRAALAGGGWPAIAFWLAASFPLHIADLRRRAEQSRRTLRSGGST